MNLYAVTTVATKSFLSDPMLCLEIIEAHSIQEAKGIMFEILQKKGYTSNSVMLCKEVKFELKESETNV